jgi:hypothetical protein
MPTYTVQQIAALYNVANGSMGADAVGEHTRIMAAIAMAESSGNSDAMNPNSTATGLWQIMHSVWVKDPDASKLFKTRDDLKNPRINAQVARIVYNKQGYSAWTVYTSGKYRKFMDNTPVDTRNIGDDIGAIAGGAATGVGGIVARSSAADKYIAPVTRWVTQGARVVGVAWLGVTLVILGFIVLAMQTKPGKAVAGTAVKAATKGVVK